MLEVFIVVCILIFLGTVVQIYSKLTDSNKPDNIDIHIHNHPVKTTKIIDSLIEKDGHTHMYHEEVEDEGSRMGIGEKSLAPIPSNLNAEIWENPDNLFMEAAKFAIESKEITASMLQRKLRIQYNRAARLIDHLEATGIISSEKPGVLERRKALINMKEFNQRFKTIE